MATAVVVALALAAAVIAAVARSNRATGLEAARKLAEQDHNWESSEEAGRTLARMTSLLFEEGERCRQASEAEATRCDAIYAAIAVTQTFAVRVTDCTAPGVFDTRRKVRTYLAAVDSLDPDAITEPAPPPAPRC